MDMDHDNDAWMAAKNLRYSEHRGKRDRNTSTKSPKPDAITYSAAKKQKGLKLALNHKLATEDGWRPAWELWCLCRDFTCRGALSI